MRKNIKIFWQRIVPGIVLILCLLASGMDVYADDAENAVNDARYGVVRILVITSDGGLGTGTGFGVGGDGEYADTFVTNWHVVTLSGNYDYQDVGVYILLDDETTFEYDTSGSLVDINFGEMVPCEVLYAENEYPDVAILRTEEPVSGVETLSLRRVSQDFVGLDIYTIGYPASADIGSRSYNDDGSVQEILKGSVEAVSVTGGTVSRCTVLETFGNTECVVHDAHINSGNSGGPLLLDDGSVIGINTYGYGEDTTEYSVSIYIDYAIDALDGLGLTYTMAGSGDTKEDETDGILLIAVIVIIAAVLIVVVFFILNRQKKQNQSGAGSKSGEGAGLRIQGVSGAFAGRRFRLDQDVVIGRNPDRCAIVFPAGTAGVSSVHCAIKVLPGRLTVIDLGSTYGTFVNGRRLAPNQPCELRLGDRLSIGSDKEMFRITGKGGVV